MVEVQLVSTILCIRQEGPIRDVAKEFVGEWPIWAESSTQLVMHCS